MAGTNTEQPANKAEQKKIIQVAKPNKAKVDKVPATKIKKVEETKAKETKAKEAKAKEAKVEETKKAEAKENKNVKVVKKPKKDSVKAYGKGIPVSTKVAVAICKFLKRKTVEKAITDLEEVAKLKRAVPMKGEIPHRKGPMMSGRFPQRAAKEFIMLLKSLQANANQNDLEVPVITGAVSSKGQLPYAKGGRARGKATHVTLVATEKKITKSKNKKE
ncbi:MAG: hypothetical protein PF542_00520 [Nanoarchaeota archaeon]|jgi:large subunit ribosomal protein L22|nr:hypothetical protein [Nanoarchaeota archaeon]